MAFVLAQTESYSWPVTVEFPIDGGRFEKQSFDAVFKRLPQTRIREIWDLIQAGELNDDELCAEVLTGWRASRTPRVRRCALAKRPRPIC